MPKTGSIDSVLDAKRFLLANDELFRDLHAKLVGVQLYEGYISLSKLKMVTEYPTTASECQEFLNRLGRITIAERLLDDERKKVLLTHPSDAEQREEWYNSP